MATIDDIRLTLTALERATFTIVAREQHVSQSTVSRAVQRVESELGVTLFERDGRGTRPRATATSTADRLRAMVRIWDELAGRADPVPPSLSIYCTVTASQSIVPQLLSKFRRAYPSTKLELRTGPASAALDAARSGEVDAAIAPLPDRLPKSMASVPITSTPLVAIRAVDYPRPRDWSHVHLVAPRQGVTRALVDRWRQGLGPNHTLQETESHEEVVALTALGSGVGIVPKLVVESSALRSLLREVRPPTVLPTMRIGLCARSSALRNGELAHLWSMVSSGVSSGTSDTEQ